MAAEKGQRVDYIEGDDATFNRGTGLKAKPRPSWDRRKRAGGHD